MAAEEFTTKAALAYRLSMTGYFIQYFLIAVSTLWLVPSNQQPNPVACVFIMVPLLILLPWLLKRSIRAHIWLCFIMLGYFTAAVENAFLYAIHGWIPFIEIANTVLVFNAAMLFARWEQKRLQISVTR